MYSKAKSRISLSASITLPGSEYPYSATYSSKVSVNVVDTAPWTTKTEEGTPQVEITFPPTNSQIETNFTIPFTGVAWDAEDGSLNSTAVWNSSIDGSIGNGTNISVSGLTIGVHTIEIR